MLRRSIVSGMAAILLCLTLALNVLAAEQYTVGVKAGQWIKYAVKVTYGDGSVEHQWAKVTISSITDTTIGGTIEGNATGLPEYINSFSVDVVTGITTGPMFSWLFIPTNMNPGSIPPRFLYALQGPTTRQGREALYATSTEGSQWYWDRSTGALLEAIEPPAATGWDYSITITVDETNMWGGGALSFDWWIWVVIAAVIMGVVAAAAVMLRRRKPTTAPTYPQAPQPPPPPPP